MVMAKSLFELQQIELDVDRCKKSLSAIDDGLTSSKRLDDAILHNVEAERVVQLFGPQQKELELSLQKLENQIRKLQEKMYSGTVTNHKELTGFQDESEMLFRQKSKGEDALLELMFSVEEAQNRYFAAKEHLTKTESGRKSEKEWLLSEKTRLNGEITQLTERREELTGTLSVPHLDLFRRLQKSKGLPVATVEQGSCRGCGLKLTSHELQRVRTSQDIMRCSSCSRILYFS